MKKLSVAIICLLCITRTVCADEITIHEQSSIYINGFYALDSYKQFNDMNYHQTLNTFDSISFGWATAEVGQGIPVLTFSSKKNDFRQPVGSEIVVDKLNDEEIDKNLMIYANKNFHEILENQEFFLEQIVALKDYDGFVIDFEYVPKDLQQSYIQFLNKLRGVLPKEQVISVCVPPLKWFDYYDYKGINEVADFMIFMAHDYEPPFLIKNQKLDGLVYTPQSPVNEITKDLEKLKALNVDFNKVLLQLSFNVSQWQTKNGKVFSQSGEEKVKPFHPTYAQLMRRMRQMDDNGQLDNAVYLDPLSQNPYLTYFDKENKIENIIWYENSDSVKAKIELVESYGLRGISLWRIGSIPDYYNYDLDIWYQLNQVKQKKLKEETVE